MYKIKAITDGKEYTIHYPRIKALTLGKPYFEIADNVNGKAEFTMYKGHPYFESLKKLSTDIVIYKDNTPEFYGRILSIKEDMAGNKKVFIEGELAFLCDSLQRPKVYHNTTVDAYFKDLINVHNAQVEERKRFVVGFVTVTDPNNSLYRYSNYDTTRKCISEKLIKRLGGHIVIRHENGLRIIDYLDDATYYRHNSQKIEFGKNLLDFSRNVTADDLATCIVPLGAKLDEAQQDPNLEAIREQRVTIKSVNGDIDYVMDANAVKEYGKIFKTVIFEDVSVPANLKRKGEEYLHGVQFEKMILELKAIDLNFTDEKIEGLKVGDMITCTSAIHGLDKEFPLSKKKIYLTQFSENRITLGKESSNPTYTSSNQNRKDEIEQIVNNIPSRSEILETAKKDAQNLINKQVLSGYALHEPNEFIVTDHLDYKNKAKNLWRWGAGGLAHYSNGYNGPIDGVAITMDGKINGKMLMANTVVAESIDVNYRTSVETSIDDKVGAAKNTIETSIKNMEKQIHLSVRETKVIASQKNYITDGEQENLNANSFSMTIPGGYLDNAQYLNMKCFKFTLSNTSDVKITQYLGMLPAGKYEVRVAVAYPRGKAPEHISIGFMNSGSITYFNALAADEFHVLKNTIEITRGQKSFELNVYATGNAEFYITNIRVLRSMDDLVDDLNAKLDLEVGSITASVNKIYENSSYNYCTNPTFSLTENFRGWTKSSETAITKAYYLNKNCAKITNGATTENIYWRQNPFKKSGPIKLRFNAACAVGQDATASLQCKIDRKVFDIPAGSLTSAWRFFEFEANATIPYFDTFFINKTANTSVYITDVEIVGYYSGYAESQIQVLQDSITSTVKKGEFGSYVQQYYDKVVLGFNSNSKYVQINPGEIGIYDYGITEQKKRAVFDENGNHFYRDSYYVGKIGTNSWIKNNAHKGLVFDLETQGKYMTWAYKKNQADGFYTTVLTFSRASSMYTEEGLHAGCDLDMHGWTIKNPSFEGGGITATMNFIQILEVDANGKPTLWGPNAYMRFQNGILVDLNHYSPRGVLVN